MKSHALSLAVVVVGTIVGCGDEPHGDAGSPGVDAGPSQTDTGGLDGAVDASGVPVDAPASDAGPDPSVCLGPVVHVSTTGSDTSGDGSSGAPWASVAFAASHATAGATIHVASGTYLETTTIELPVGVCLEGEGEGTVLRSTLTAQWVPMLALRSPEGTLGNQSVSALSLDGQAHATSWGLVIAGRSNVDVHHLHVTDFFESGVIFSGLENAGGATAPTVYATGNRFHDSTIHDSATNDGNYGRGNLQFGGQDGMRVFGNVITQPERTPGQTNDIGWPIKMANEGHIRNCRVYDNQLLRTPFIGINGAGQNWNFAFEMWNIEGLEMWGNTFHGAVDLAAVGRGSSEFGVYIHDNVFLQPELNDALEDGIRLEVDERDVIIDHNHFENLAHGVVFSPHRYPGTEVGTTLERVQITRNVFQNMGVIGQVGHSVLRFDNQAENPETTVRDFLVAHNVFLGRAEGEGIYMGMGGPSYSGVVENVRIYNNVFQHFQYAALSFGAGYMGMPTTLSGLEIRNNLVVDCGNGNEPLFSSADAPGLVLEGAVHAPPMLGADATPLPSSPLIDAGYDYGQPFLGSAPDIGAVEVMP
ncbi:MAG: hypothetical protein K1X94_27795 [Sandaracinaceae bacterium]|nr:hypothetical protein [Sandaracinaceae bacterium]